MGSFANSLFKIMLGWLQGIVSAVWSAFTSEKGNSLFNWIGRNWILIAGALCVVGLAADLCVYIFRWKPFRVWKSFFSKDKEAEETEEESRGSVHNEIVRKRIKASETDTVREPVQIERADPLQEPDFSKWQEKTEEPRRTDIQPAEKPVTVTNAGYVIPEDSPYRRPAVKTPAQAMSGQYAGKKETTASGTDRNEPNPVAPRRRRRINVTELFTDPEEELRQFDAPQNVIDSRKAYREPVYPHGWQKSEDKEE